MRKIFSILAALTLSVGVWATNTIVADLPALQTALSTVDTVYVSQTISLTNGTNLNAQGKVISVPKPCMAETGMIAAESSNYTALNIAGSVSIANATILGGNGGNAGGNTISTDNPLVIVATKDENITPIFQAEQRTFEIATGVNARMGTLDKDYPWIKTTAKPGVAYRSTNEGKNSSDSRDTLIITPEDGVYYRLSFDYAVSSEEGFDKMSIWVNGNVVANNISGEESGSYDSGVTLLTGLTTIVMSYGKEVSGGGGDDRGYIYNIQVQVYNTPPAIHTVKILDSEGGSVSGLAPQGKYLSGEEVSLTAVVLEGYEFKEWQDGNGNPISTSNPLSFTVTQDTTILPNLIPEVREFTLTTGVTARMGTLDKDYPWIKTTTKPGLAYRSTNKGINYSDSRDTLIITPADGVSYRVKFDYAVSSEEGFDKMSIWVNDELIADEISGEESGSYDSGVTLLTGLTTIVMSYGKEVSGGLDEDRGYIYNIVVTSDAQVYTRTVTNGDWGTICLPWESVALEGGDFYDVLGTKHAEYGVALTPVEAPDQLTAGKPYVFRATSDQIKVTYYPSTEVEEEVYDNNHIIGSFDGCDVPEGKYIIVNNLLYKTADATSTIGANRAYFDVDAMDEYTPSQAPGRKVVFMGGKTIPTGEWGIENGEMKMNGKYIMNGQFVIVRDGKMYNVLGL